MARRIPPGVEPALPDFDAKAAEQGRSTDLCWNLPCRLVTPLFGGGHTAGEVDPVTPISPKAIRGQLRFWWRTLLAASLPNPTSLPHVELIWLREAEIFGSTDLPSPFDLLVDVIAPLRYRRLHDGRLYGFSDGFGPEAYALFSAKQREVAQIVREGLEFQLTIRWPDRGAFAKRCSAERRRRNDENQRRLRGNPRRPANEQLPLLPEPWTDLLILQQQMTAALWGWFNFGGLGARTRRGLGAVTTDRERFSFLGDKNEQREPIPGMTVFCDRACSGAAAAMDAWSQSVRVYRDFRQACRGSSPPKDVLKYDGSRSALYVERSKGTPGRTEWPEPDSLRDPSITGCSLKPVTLAPGLLPAGQTYTQRDHSAAVDPNVPLPSFPRAMLGLPIVFHFADGSTKASREAGISPQDRDPPDAQLLPRFVDSSGQDVGNRMASPVITRPLFFHGGWHPAVIILRGPHLQTLEAKVKTQAVNATGQMVPRNVTVPHSQIVNPAFNAIPRMQGQSDALAALEVFVQSQGFNPLGSGGSAS